jgi:hypothetical protein
LIFLVSPRSLKVIHHWGDARIKWSCIWTNAQFTFDGLVVIQKGEIGKFDGIDTGL